ncbi:MAG: hypothetical protein QM723_00790 [Myxococcaceae bacterium]
MLTLIFPLTAFAQADAGKTANPATEGAAELQRSSGLPDGATAAPAGTSNEAAQPAPAADNTPPTDPSKPGQKEEAVQGPAPTNTGAPATPRSVLVEDDGVTGHIGGQLRFSYQKDSSFPADNAGTTFSPGPMETRVRVIPEVHYRGFGFLAEADTATGAVLGNPDDKLIVDQTPHPAFNPLDMRQVYLEYKWRTGIFRVGQQTSQWGLGMVANAGAKDPEAGDFGQTHFGDSAYRALLAGRPFFNLGGAWRALEPALAVDLVVRDGTANYADGDRAVQGVFALRFAADAEKYLGFYAVYRHQTAVNVNDGSRAADVIVLDLAGKWHFMHNDWRDLYVGFEGAYITGTTTLGRTDTAPQYDVRQFGAAVKASYRYGNGQVYLDFGYASGDQNPNDAKQEAFKFNRDYPVGLVLFNEVLGYQSARAAARASDPNLLGRPPEGVNLVPTQGAFTGAVYLFPKVRYGVREWLDVYGGPMFAWTSAKLTDPFNSKIGGGTSINYLGAHPGDYLGTELDVGLQVRFHPVPQLTLSGTLEGGVLFPGDAFNMGVGGVMGPVGLGRIRLSANL